MAENSKIEWCTHTLNPWIGCTKVGPGCDHCYAESMMDHRYGRVQWGADSPRARTSDANWRKPLAWNKAAEGGPRPRVFCASLADVFDNEVPDAWRSDLWRLIQQTPNLDWLLLTKRIGNAHKMLPAFMKPYPNLWLGATVVNQEEADRDIPKLLAIPATVRFLSCEPLLGPLDVYGGDPDPRLGGVEAGHGLSLEQFWKADGSGPFPGIDWVICGGESGPKARPMHPDWARSLRDQCQAARVPFHFKQWGEWTPGENVDRTSGVVKTADWFGDQWSFGEEDLSNTDGHIDDQPDLYRVGKKDAGRLLDGRTWDEGPVVASDDEDPTPYCHVCGAMELKHCDCPDPFYAENH